MTTLPNQLPAPGLILVLNGPSSSGKSSIARELQSQLPFPIHHLQLDAFRAMEPPNYWDGWEQQDTQAVTLKMQALCGAMNAALREPSTHGQSVIYDTALTNPEARRCFATGLSGLPVLIVGVSCSGEELAPRETSRADRPAGLASSQMSWIHARMKYDLQVDTSSKSAAAVAGEVAAWLASEPEPRAYELLFASNAP